MEENIEKTGTDRVVEVLEQMITEVRKHKIDSIFVVAQGKENNIASMYSANYLEMLGSIEMEVTDMKIQQRAKASRATNMERFMNDLKQMAQDLGASDQAN